MLVDTDKETLSFQAEVTQLLDLMAHSLYSNKEIFLRELISNASDAVDRLRFAMLSDANLSENDPMPKICVTYDRDARLITVADNGIGMTREEVIEQIGTIAKSGTREFLQSLTGNQQKDANLIGQFGVGFYSVFVVADKVTLTTRCGGLDPGHGVRWVSDGQGQYTIETAEKATRGTQVSIHLRPGEDELLNSFRLRSIIGKYSDHISVPIMMKVEGKDNDEEEAVNSASALWARSKSDINAEEYAEFYKHIAHDFDEPLAYVHSRMEGTNEYILLLYIPMRAPYDLWSRDRRHGVKLYVHRVFILDTAEQLIPRYLRFVCGVIDSSDLPLNVSREMLQHNKLVDAIRSSAAKKVLALLTDLATKDKDKYAIFWNAFGRILKEGIAEDSANREIIASLFRFASTRSSTETQDISLEEYIARMKEDQDKIYYITAERFSTVKGSPLLEIFKKKGVEVLLLSDPVDNLWVADLLEFKGIPLQSISKGTVDLSKLEDEQEKEERQKSTVEVQVLLERLKRTLAEQVKEVRVTTRLTISPACLVVDEYAIDLNFQHLLKASGQLIPTAKPILEINPHHPIILKLKYEEDEKRFTDWAYILFDQSILSLDGKLENPIHFINRLNNFLAQL